MCNVCVTLIRDTCKAGEVLTTILSLYVNVYRGKDGNQLHL